MVSQACRVAAAGAEAVEGAEITTVVAHVVFKTTAAQEAEAEAAVVEDLKVSVGVEEGGALPC